MRLCTVRYSVFVALVSALSAISEALVKNFSELTSMKPCMKFFGNRAFGSSSALKYFRTCVSCFQKFNVSCRIASISHAFAPLPGVS